jgi:hypothetical protein
MGDVERAVANECPVTEFPSRARHEPGPAADAAGVEGRAVPAVGLPPHRHPARAGPPRGEFDLLAAGVGDEMLSAGERSAKQTGASA